MNTYREFIHDDKTHISSHKKFLRSNFLTNDEKIQKSKRTLSYVVYYVYNMFSTDTFLKYVLKRSHYSIINVPIQYLFASYKFRKVINKFNPKKTSYKIKKRWRMGNM
jgi:hypothetical protein